MTRPRTIPERGDVPPAMVAQRLGLTLEAFAATRVELERRGFPAPDETTGLYCIEAVDRWRLRRHARLFPELTGAPMARQADEVYDGRMQRLFRV